MRTAVRVFGFSSAFSLVVAVVYWFVSYERAGSVLLATMVAAPLVMGGYLFLRSRGRARPAEDDPDASHASQAGADVGRFAGGTIWPFVMAVGAAVALEGFVYGIWLLVPGLLIFVWSILGLMAESHG